MALRIEIEPIGDKIPLMGELLRQHWDEIARNKQLMIVKPDTERYLALDAAGVILALWAYDDDQLVGYSVNLFSNHLHYADLFFVQNDVLFIAKPYRNSPLGLRLIRETEKAAKARGAQMMLWHAKENTPLALILPRLGCGVQDIVFSKEL